MPNWCTIQFTVQGTPEAVAKFKDAMVGMEAEKEHNVFDFERLVPMSVDLNIENDTHGSIGHDVFYNEGRQTLQYPWVAAKGITTLEALRDHLRKESPRYVEQGALLQQNILKYGAPTWYEWASQNWGTKWNSCDAHREELEDGSLRYTFDTAWAFPEPIFYAVAERFPDVDIHGTMVEEGGEFHGEFFVRDGNFDIDYQAGRPEGYEDCYEDEPE